MKHFVFAISTFNRVQSLKRCIDTWIKTKSNDVRWTLIIADDGSNDGTIEYIDNLKIDAATIKLIRNNRIGIHQQVNTIIKYLSDIEFDFCFKADDDIVFLKSGWDLIYYETALDSGYHHLVFFEPNWCKEQHIETPVHKDDLESNIGMLNVHGFFYTLTKDVVLKVGYFDYENFGFRGMGHVDYTFRCSKAGFNDLNYPFDVKNSSQYISAHSEDYKSALNNDWISHYDQHNRDDKVKIIQDENRIFIPYQKIQTEAQDVFKDQIIKALNNSYQELTLTHKEVTHWYEEEIKKIKQYYESYSPSMREIAQLITDKVKSKFKL